MAQRTFKVILVACVALSFGGWSSSAHSETVEENPLPPVAQVEIDFVRDILPIFSETCFSCHGPEKQEGGLRLDVKETGLRGGDTSPLAISGDSVESEIIYRVTATDQEEVMPAEGDRLVPEQIGLLRAWVEQGMPWPDDASAEIAQPDSDHWAFKPPTRAASPSVKNPEWVRNPIDSFVLARLEKEGIGPSPVAAPETLVRRLYLDLIGLPPTPEELDAYRKDKGPNKYQRLVNTLLSSPHFGERWGRHWLDVARYADTDGYEKDLERPYAYKYRDWVIEAFNRDLSYDQFITEQLAGDLLPNASLDQRIATGFHRNTLTNKEGGIDPEEDRVKIAVDRTNTTASVFMGLSMGCAQCHTHKYDPITHHEYYQFYSFFNTTQEIDIPATDPSEWTAFESAKERNAVESEKLLREIEEYRPKLSETVAEWEASLDVPPMPWEALDPISFTSAGGAGFRELEDYSLLVTGSEPDTEKYDVVAWSNQTGIKAVRLQALTHPELTRNGPGRAHNGNFVLAEFRVYASPAGKPHEREQVKIKEATTNYGQAGYEIEYALDDDVSTGWAIFRSERTNEDRHAVFVFEEEVGYPEGTLFTFEMEHHYGRQHSIGRMRFSVSKEIPGEMPFPEAVHRALLISSEQRSEEQQNTVIDYYGREEPHMRELLASRAALERAKPKEPATKAQSLTENETPPRTFVHIRGNFMTKGDEVPSAGPMVLPAMQIADTARPTRLDLARWLVSPEHPLTARVQVNRVWQYLLGQGLVTTPEDYGTQGTPPSHPELLDWLALEYQAMHWSTKDLIRLIANTSTYKQSSRSRTELINIDPQNVLLARQNRFRVEAEITRDLNLAVSGLLVPRIGGPSVRPPLPQSVADLGYAGSVKWAESAGEAKYRRGLYIFFQRTVPYPMLMTFDCPDSNVSSVKRTRSNTPLQALTLLNNTVFYECAQELGMRILASAPESDEERIRYVYKLCLAREPSDMETERLLSFVDHQRERFREDLEAARQFAAPHEVDDESLPDTATFMALARAVTNLDEFLTRE